MGVAGAATHDGFFTVMFFASFDTFTSAGFSAISTP